MYSQYKGLNINVLSNDSIIELLRIIKDPELRSQILDKLPTTSESDNKIENIHSTETTIILSRKGPFVMGDIKRMIREDSSHNRITTIHDLSSEIDNLKREISELKVSNIALDKSVFKLEKSDLDEEFGVDITEKAKVEEKSADKLLGATNYAKDEGNSFN